MEITYACKTWTITKEYKETLLNLILEKYISEYIMKVWRHLKEVSNYKDFITVQVHFNLFVAREYNGWALCNCQFRLNNDVEDSMRK